MIVGSGFIAKAFKKYKSDKKVLVFASGVSSSKSCTVFDCNREEALIRKVLSGCSSQTLFIYFSSCSISSSNLVNDIYHVHKRRIEGVIQEYSNRSTIFRLSNVVGSDTNPNTLFYFLAKKIKLQENFNLWRGVKRNIIDINDVVAIVDYIINNDLFKNEIINVANLKDNTVDEIVDEISKYFKVEAQYSIVNCDDNYDINTDKIKPIVRDLNLNFDIDYLKSIVEKYCNNI